MIDAILHYAGMAFLWLFAICLLLVFPLTEFARYVGGAPFSKGGCLFSLAGIVLILILLFG